MVQDFITSQYKRNREIVAYGSLGLENSDYIEPDTRKQTAVSHITYGGGLMTVRDDDTVIYGDGDGGGNRVRHEEYTVHVGGGQGSGGMGRRIALTPRLHLTIFGGVGGGGGGVGVTENQDHNPLFGQGGADALALKSGFALDYRFGGRFGFIVGVRVGYQLPLLRFGSKRYRSKGLTIRFIYGFSILQNPTG